MIGYILKSIFISSILSIFLFSGCNSEVQEDEQVRVNENTEVVKFVPALNQFESVWNRVVSDPVEVYPQESVAYSKLFDGAVDLIFKNAQRTLRDNSDVLEHFDKLAHPNGVCVRGVWEIDTNNAYGGYFKNGSKALLIGRASSAMSNTKRGENRAFGLAGKLFPSMNELELHSAPSANFFVIDDLGGTKAEYFTDVELTNAPEVSFTSSVFGALAYGIKVASAFSDADSNSGERQLYEISYLGEESSADILTPRWMKIDAQEGQTKLGVDDFREEFMLDINETLVFNISVSSSEVDGVKQWQQIGSITFDDAVVSNTCDHGLHFHHPLWREDLVYE